MTDEMLKTLEEPMQDIARMNDPLEPIKVASAYKSECMKLEFRKKNMPDKVSVLDYTIMAALLKQIATSVMEKNDIQVCPTCGKEFLPFDVRTDFCDKCGQKLYWKEKEDGADE